MYGLLIIYHEVGKRNCENQQHMQKKLVWFKCSFLFRLNKKPTFGRYQVKSITDNAQRENHSYQ